MAFLFSYAKIEGKRCPQLKVKRLEELVEGRAVIPNRMRDINLPVYVAGGLPLLQSAPESTTITSVHKW